MPGLYNTQLLNRLFPLILSISPYSGANWNQQMFSFFWDEVGSSLWTEDAFDSLFRLLAKRELTDLVPYLFSSKTSQAIFAAMSYQYRGAFIEHLLQMREDVAEEI